MSVTFLVGNSGSGKSYYLQDYMIRESMAHPQKNYFYIVPEQFTMSTQRAFVTMHPDHTIMNIDVLSFPRLAYRIFTELGLDGLSVLDDTAKNLILHRIAAEHPEKFPVLGKKLKRPGYIDEMKSLISEFTQYHISVEELLEMGETEGMPPLFHAKTAEIAYMYEEFLRFIEGDHITSEQMLEVLASVIEDSSIVKDGVFVFDGFTGFTPLQNDVVERLMPITQQMIFSVIMDPADTPYSSFEEHELFAMSKKYMSKVSALAKTTLTDVTEPICLPLHEHSRFDANSTFGYLESHIFRSSDDSFTKDASQSISIVMTDNPREELEHCGNQIRKMVREDDLRYQDIAIVCSDLNTYKDYIQEIFPKYDIPVFTDASAELSYQPAIEMLLSFLEMLEKDFSYESVMHFLRTGLCGFSVSDVDLFDSYLYRSGIRGYKKYSHVFTVRPKEFSDEDLLRINEIREELITVLKPVVDEVIGDTTVAKKSSGIKELFIKYSIEEKMVSKSEEYLSVYEDEVKSQEYACIYEIILNLLQKIDDVLGEESVSPKEYSDLLRAGFSASKIGVIPPLMDAVVFGDLERTRLEDVRVLFLLGAVDGLIPKEAGAAGIFSQNERDLLKDADYELAPTQRERSFMQKFYLYQILTKAKEKLIISYFRLDSDGAGVRKSYLVKELFELFPELSLEIFSSKNLGLEELNTYHECKNRLIHLCHELRIRGSLDEKETSELAALLSYFDKTHKSDLENILKGVFFRFENDAISKAVARGLNGSDLHISVSKLEKYSQCAYQYFLQYGLRLQERREHAFEAYDIGNVYHEALNRFSQIVSENEGSWKEVPDEKVSSYIKEAVHDTYATLEKTEVYEKAREIYVLHRLEETLKRTVWAVMRQVKKGSYEPKGFEVSLSQISNLASLTYELSDDSKLHLEGKIDRIDTSENDENIYVKIIDYKSGNKDFDILSMYYGLQIQLVFYMGVGVEGIQNSHPDKKVLPGAMLYYHLDNPFVEAGVDEALVEEAILKSLRPKGCINDSDASIAAIDSDFSEGKVKESTVAHLKAKTGGLAAASQVASEEDFKVYTDFVKKKVIETGENIIAGNIDVLPYKEGENSGCTYCPYHSICGFDLGLEGYSYKKFDPSINKNNVLDVIKECLDA